MVWVFDDADCLFGAMPLIIPFNGGNVINQAVSTALCNSGIIPTLRQIDPDLDINIAFSCTRSLFLMKSPHPPYQSVMVLP